MNVRSTVKRLPRMVQRAPLIPVLLALPWDMAAAQTLVLDCRMTPRVGSPFRETFVLDMGRKETSRGYMVFIASDRIDIFAPSLRGPGHPNDYVMIDRFTGTLRGVWRREGREISVDGRCTRTQEQKF